MNDLQLRALTAEDLPAYWKLACAAFHSKNPGLEDEGAFLENCVKKEKAEKENPTALGNCLTRTGLFSEGKLLSTLTANAFEIHFDGTVCEMCGIGGVMSDPSARKTGGVTRILRQELAAMRDRGQVFSHLSPFRSSFYRKFGYVHCAFAERWTIPAQFLPEESFAVQWYENKPEEQQAVKALYQTFAAQYNLSVRRNDLRWASIFKKLQPYSGSNFSYLHYGEDGPDGFLSYHTKTFDNAPMTILVDHLYFTSPAALRKMLAFLGSQRAYAAEVQLTLPEDADITFWLKEICTAYDKCNVRREKIHLGASRVVDVASVLKLARYQGSGVASIRVDDPVCPWNDSVFRVEFDGCCRSVAEADDWDIRLGIDAFTALILGSRELSQSCYMDGVEIRGNMENLQKIFYKKSLWIGDGF